MNKTIVLFCTCSILSCEDNSKREEIKNNEDTNWLELYMVYDKTDDGYYLFNYPKNKNNSYGEVRYKTDSPLTRVSWFSPNEFIVVLFNDTIRTSIINYSTYSNEDSWGKQFWYVYKDHIGDTLTIIGTNYSVNDTTHVIIK